MQVKVQFVYVIEPQTWIGLVVAVHGDGKVTDGNIVSEF